MIDLSKAAEKFSIKPDGESLMKMWALAEKMPGGTALFSKLVGRMAPYSGSIGARVADLAPGRARLELEDHKAVRNHLDSVHAIALANLAEMASGLAMLAGLPAGMRGILTRIEVDYTKKARGTLTAVAEVEPPADGFEGSLVLPVTVRDEAGDVVVAGQFHWKIGPARS
jgi:acyl-coenzyme A thioesterase PaaI-like protein